MSKLAGLIAVAWNVLASIGQLIYRTVTVLTMLAFLGITAALASGLIKPPPLPDRMTLQISLPGMLPDMSNLASLLAAVTGDPKPALFELTDALYTAATDPRVGAVVAKLGPGRFDLAQNQAIAAALDAVKAAGKPTYVFSDSFGELSPGYAAYHLASAFDEIWLQPVGQLAATGIAVETNFYGGLLDSLGIRREFGFREEYKIVQHHLLFAGPTGAQAEMMQDLATNLQSQTEEDIARGRGMSPRKLHDLLNDAPYTDTQALALNLVDKLGYEDELLNSLTARYGEAVLLPTYLRKMARRYRQEDAPSVGLVAIEGALARGTGGSADLFGGRSQGADSIAKAIDHLASQERIETIILRIDSPGGSPAAAETIRRAVVSSQARGKRVIASMASTAGSGAYWLAASADRILAESATLTGSIGVAGGKLDVSGLLASLGIRTAQIETTDRAGMWSMSRAYTASEAHARDRLLDAAYARFIVRVAEGRGIGAEKVAKIAKGRIWTGREAYELGLIDRLGGLETAIAEARVMMRLPPNAPINLVRANRPNDVPQLVRTLFGTVMGSLTTMLQLELADLRVVA